MRRGEDFACRGENGALHRGGRKMGVSIEEIWYAEGWIEMWVDVEVSISIFERG